MSLLGLDDGAGSSTGNGYLDIVDFILQGCVDVQQNLRELFRRVAFNVMFGNTDDHFRNHGLPRFPAYPKRVDARTCLRHKSWSQIATVSTDRPIYRAIRCQSPTRRLQ